MISVKVRWVHPRLKKTNLVGFSLISGPIDIGPRTAFEIHVSHRISECNTDLLLGRKSWADEKISAEAQTPIAYHVDCASEWGLPIDILTGLD
jgi:hypothetical protein